MTWLFDQPIYIVLLGVLLAVLVGGAWTASGRKEFLYGLVGVAALTVALLVVERFVVTDNEAIRKTLVEIARAVQSNNLRRLVEHIDPKSTSVVQEAEAEMPNYSFTECRVTKIHKVDIDAASEPRSAVVEFNVVAAGTFSADGMKLTQRVPRWVRLQLVRSAEGEWLVQNYEHAAPQQFMLGQPPAGQ
ncbi:MAG: hypothetical protein WD872_08555 [Pirellulaceae bacterium]